jgi:coenzyme Q-binding protein COQ10
VHCHRVTRILPYTPEQLFELVGDVAEYPKFVPWITSMHTSRPRVEGEGVTTLDAEASVGFAFLKERFSTRVRRDAARHQITVTLISGPFRKLRNTWLFRPDEAGCKVIFDIEFEFKSKLLDMMLAANFDRAVNKLIGCFQAQAERLYGSDADARVAANG